MACTPWTSFDGARRLPPGRAVEAGVQVHRHRSWRLPFKNPLEKDAVTPGFWAEALRPADLDVCVGFPSLHLDALVGATRLRRAPLVVQNYVTAEALAEILAGEGGLNRKIRRGYWRHWVRRELAAAELVIADSPAAARALGAELGLDNVRMHIGMAVDPGEFSAAAGREGPLRARLGLGADRLVVAPSRVSRQKGADLLVEALRPLLGEGWRLVIAGPTNEADFGRRLDEAIAGHPRIHRVELERLDQVALIAAASIVALPSRGETVGGVVFEGMYAGALVIVSDAVEAARELYLRDNGLMVPSEDVPALRAALARGMAEPMHALREAGRRMVETTYTWPRSVDRLWALYEEAMRA